METETLTGLINNFGFPIAAFLLVAYLLYKQLVQAGEQNKEWAQAIERNTAVMSKVLDRLESEHNAHKGN